jgi:hypothetical protein
MAAFLNKTAAAATATATAAAAASTGAAATSAAAAAAQPPSTDHFIGGTGIPWDSSLGPQSCSPALQGMRGVGTSKVLTGFLLVGRQPVAVFFVL